MNLLLIEDDRITARITQEALEQQGHSVDLAEEGERGLELATSHPYDIIILDILLPGRSGIEICAEARRAGVLTPILMLTALDNDPDIVRGLDSGADDYLTKPFHFEVLLARIRSLHRRHIERNSGHITVADLVLDTESKRVERKGVVIDLTAKELILLEFLMLHSGRPVSRTRISEHVWEMSFDPQSNVVDSLVRRLRNKIDHGHSPQLIHTVRGKGYILSTTPWTDKE